MGFVLMRALLQTYAEMIIIAVVIAFSDAIAVGVVYTIIIVTINIIIIIIIVVAVVVHHYHHYHNFHHHNVVVIVNTTANVVAILFSFIAGWLYKHQSHVEPTWQGVR